MPHLGISSWTLQRGGDQATHQAFRTGAASRFNKSSGGSGSRHEDANAGHQSCLEEHCTGPAETEGEGISMRMWKRVALVNLSALVGAIAALFSIPGTTPVWVWALASIGFLIVVNFVMFRRRGSKVGGDASNGSAETVMAIVLLILVVLDLVLSRLLQH
jgi:hypothetical protein